MRKPLFGKHESPESIQESWNQANYVDQNLELRTPRLRSAHYQLLCLHCKEL